MEAYEEMLNESKLEYNNEIVGQVEQLGKDISALNSKLVCIRFKIERKCIKNGAREERRQSIHKLEVEKNLLFHPKKDRSKSIPNINMNLRLKALKDMKEDIIIRRSKISDEIHEDEYELIVPVNHYNYNSIKREILEKPIEVTFTPQVRNKRVIKEHDSEQSVGGINDEEEKKEIIEEERSASEHQDSARNPKIEYY